MRDFVYCGLWCYNFVMNIDKKKIKKFIFGSVFLGTIMLVFFGYYLFSLKPFFVPQNWSMTNKLSFIDN